jgi:hypothetical protein
VLTPGETAAIDGAGSPATWLFMDAPFTVRDLAIGPAGTLALAGSVYDRDFVFGGTNHANVGGSDGSLATLTAAGSAGFSRGFGSPRADEALAVAVRPSGSVIASGFFRETIDLGGTTLTDLRIKPGFSDPYFGFDTGALLVFEVAANGTPVWSRAITSASGEGSVSAVALAPNGDVVVAGSARGELDFGTGSSAGDGIFVARLGVDGEILSSARFTGPSAHVSAVAADAAGVVIAGSFRGALDLGNGPLPDTGPDDDGFVARIAPTGAPVWAISFGGDGEDRAAAVALTADGSAVVVGYFSRALDLGEPVTRESETGFAARVGPGGTIQWARAFSGSGRSRAISVAVGEGDRTFVGGGYRDGVDLGGGEMLADTDDGFVTGIAGGDGAHLFSRRIARFNFAGLVQRDGMLFVAGTCEGVCAIGGEVVPPASNGRLLVAALSTEPTTHVARWTRSAELHVEGASHPVRSAIAVPGTAPENPGGITLILSASEIDCSASSQLPRSIAQGGARRTAPELALLLKSAELGWHNVTSWLSQDGGGDGGSAMALLERITANEITAYVEHHVERTGSSETASYVMGNVDFRRCF